MKVMIVDDEPVIAQGVADLIANLPFRGEELQVAGIAHDSAEALYMLSSRSVDVVITDIRMPGMDGLGLTETIRHRHPEVFTVLLSGYSDLSYMQQAIRLKAADYLVKPVKPEDLASALERIRHMLLKESQKHDRYLGRRAFLDLPTPFKAVVSCDADDGGTERIRQFGDEEMLVWLFHKVVLETAAEFPRTCVLAPEVKISPFNLLVGLYGDSEDEVRRRAARLAGAVHSFYTGTVKLPASFGISSTNPSCTGQDDRLESEACTALLSRLRQGSGIHSFAACKQALSASKEKRAALVSAIELRDEANILKEAERALRTILLTGEGNMIAPSLEELLFFIYTELQDSFDVKDPLFSARISGTMKQLLWMRNTDQVLHAALQEINLWLERLDPDCSMGRLVDRAKAFIRRHCRSPLKIADAAKAVYVSPSHLSRLFRDKAGTTFLEYLTQVRIEEAKRLLGEPDTKIYSVAELVGYQDWKHFSRIFKELTGYLPSDYRDRVRNVQPEMDAWKISEIN